MPDERHGGMKRAPRHSFAKEKKSKPDSGTVAQIGRTRKRGDRPSLLFVFLYIEADMPARCRAAEYRK